MDDLDFLDEIDNDDIIPAIDDLDYVDEIIRNENEEENAKAKSRRVGF